jgi:hypothetical protein
MHVKQMLFASLVALPAIAGDSDSFVLPAEHGPKLLRQCSRPSPNNADGYWTPTTSQITELESLLEAYLQTSVPRLLPLSNHHRQYVGFMVAGQEFIYGNFYPAGMPPSRTRPGESEYPVLFCDGGDAFWGIVYSVGDKTFKDLRFNGIA